MDKEKLTIAHAAGQLMAKPGVLVSVKCIRSNCFTNSNREPRAITFYLHLLRPSRIAVSQTIVKRKATVRATRYNHGQIGQVCHHLIECNTTELPGENDWCWPICERRTVLVNMHRSKDHSVAAIEFHSNTNDTHWPAFCASKESSKSSRKVFVDHKIWRKRTYGHTLSIVGILWKV